MPYRGPAARDGGDTPVLLCAAKPLQATNASLTSQLADVQAAAAREKQLLQDRALSAEQAWQARNKELLEQLLQKERQVAQLTLSEQAALRQAEAASSAQVRMPFILSDGCLCRVEARLLLLGT